MTNGPETFADQQAVFKRLFAYKKKWTIILGVIATLTIILAAVDNYWRGDVWASIPVTVLMMVVVVPTIFNLFWVRRRITEGSYGTSAQEAEEIVRFVESEKSP